MNHNGHFTLTYESETQWYGPWVIRQFPNGPILARHFNGKEAFVYFSKLVRDKIKFPKIKSKTLKEPTK